MYRSALVSGPSQATALADGKPCGRRQDPSCGPLPDKPVAVDDLLKRIKEELVPAAAFNGHPRWFAYITASPLPLAITYLTQRSGYNEGEPRPLSIP